MRILTFTFSALATVEWVADRNYVLDAVSSTGSCTVSTDPSVTFANVAAASGSRWDVFATRVASSSAAVSQPGLAMGVPIPAGTQLFINCTAGGTVQLHLR